MYDGKNVTVTNRGEEAFVGRFDGVSYAFPCGESVVIPARAAQFLFAYGMTDADRKRALIRNGWHTTSDPTDPHGPAAAEKRMRAFVFKKAPDSPEREKPQPIVINPKISTKDAPAAQQSAA